MALTLLDLTAAPLDAQKTLIFYTDFILCCTLFLSPGPATYLIMKHEIHCWHSAVTDHKSRLSW